MKITWFAALNCSLFVTTIKEYRDGPALLAGRYGSESILFIPERPPQPGGHKNP